MVAAIRLVLLGNAELCRLAVAPFESWTFLRPLPTGSFRNLHPAARTRTGLILLHARRSSRSRVSAGGRP